jgi:hypothetical protein
MARPTRLLVIKNPEHAAIARAELIVLSKTR